MENCNICETNKPKHNYELKYLNKPYETIKICDTCGRHLIDSNVWEQTNVIPTYNIDFQAHLDGIKYYVAEQSKKVKLKFIYYHEIKQPKKFNL